MFFSNTDGAEAYLNKVSIDDEETLSLYAATSLMRGDVARALHLVQEKLRALESYASSLTTAALFYLVVLTTVVKTSKDTQKELLTRLFESEPTEDELLLLWLTLVNLLNTHFYYEDALFLEQAKLRDMPHLSFFIALVRNNTSAIETLVPVINTRSTLSRGTQLVVECARISITLKQTPDIDCAAIEAELRRIERLSLSDKSVVGAALTYVSLTILASVVPSNLEAFPIVARWRLAREGEVRERIFKDPHGQMIFAMMAPLRSGNV